MINRYQGNSGRMERFPEPGEPADAARHSTPAQRHTAAPPENPLRAAVDGPLRALSGLTELLPGKISELELEDYILLLVLYLMYRESGDSELLIIMGAMFLL